MRTNQVAILEKNGIYGLPPLTNRQAWAVVAKFLADERIVLANEPAGVEGTWKALALRDTHSPKLRMDAWLAAFAMCATFQMITIDKAYSQFKGLELLVVEMEK